MTRKTNRRPDARPPTPLDAQGAIGIDWESRPDDKEFERVEAEAARNRVEVERLYEECVDEDEDVGKDERASDSTSSTLAEVLLTCSIVLISLLGGLVAGSALAGP